MGLLRWGTSPGDTTPILITNLHLNQNEYELWKGTAGYEDTVHLAHNIAGTFVLQPNTNPGGDVELFQIKDYAPGNRQLALTSSGNIIANNLVANGTASVAGNLIVAGNIVVYGTASLVNIGTSGQHMPTLIVDGTASLGSLTVQGRISASFVGAHARPLLNYVPLTDSNANITIVQPAIYGNYINIGLSGVPTTALAVAISGYFNTVNPGNCSAQIFASAGAVTYLAGQGPSANGCVFAGTLATGGPTVNYLVASSGISSAGDILKVFALGYYELT